MQTSKPDTGAAATTPHWNESACLQSIGLSVRAGCAAVGTDAALEAIGRQKAKWVLLARDAGQNVVKKIRDKCAFYHIPLVEWGEREQLGRACGRAQCVVIAVTDPGFAAKLNGFFGEFHGGEAFDETSSI